MQKSINLHCSRREHLCKRSKYKVIKTISNGSTLHEKYLRCINLAKIIQPGASVNILLLGIGLQGKATLHDLASSTEVSQVIAADTNYEDLLNFVTTLKTDKVTPVQVDVLDQDKVVEQMQKVQAVIVLLPQQFRLGSALCRRQSLRVRRFSPCARFYRSPEYAERCRAWTVLSASCPNHKPYPPQDAWA